MYNIKLPEMGDGGKPPPTRVYNGEPAPNAGLQKGDRKGYRWLFILPLLCRKKKLEFSEN